MSDLRGGRPERVGSVLKGLLRDRGLEEAVERASALAEWEDRVGPEIADVATPTGFDRATLFVEVRSSAWLMELRMMERKLLARLNEGREAAPYERIVFRLAGETTELPGRGT